MYEHKANGTRVNEIPLSRNVIIFSHIFIIKVFKELTLMFSAMNNW